MRRVELFELIRKDHEFGLSKRESWSGRVAEHRRSQRCRVLLIDETSLRRRHRYVTVLVNAGTGEALGVVEHRSAKALRCFLCEQGHRWLRGVEVVVTDGSEPYRAAIATHLSHATHVVDRFIACGGSLRG